MKEMNERIHREKRAKAKEKAKKNYLKAIDKIPKKAALAGEILKGEMVVPDYSMGRDGFYVSNWKDLKRQPLATDTYERFDNPLSLQIAFEDYVKWTTRNPFIKKELLKAGQSAGQIVDVEVPRPLSVNMFMAFIKVPNGWWDRKKKDENFIHLCEAIENTINSNLIDGALIGVYDAGLVAKMNKIGETVTVTHQRAINVDLKVNGYELPKTLNLDERVEV